MSVARFPIRSALSALCLFAVSTTAGAALAGPPTDYIQSQVKAVRAVLANKVKAGTPEAVAQDIQLKAIVEPVMEFDKLAERALRKHWPTLSEHQRALFVVTFRELVFQSYLSKVRSADEQYSIVYEAEEAKSRTEAVVTAIAKTKKADIELVFNLSRRDANLWVAEDVVIDEVSLTENYREQFNRIIATDGFDALIKKMQERLIKLGTQPPTVPEAGAAATPAAAGPTGPTIGPVSPVTPTPTKKKPAAAP